MNTKKFLLINSDIKEIVSNIPKQKQTLFFTVISPCKTVMYKKEKDVYTKVLTKKNERKILNIDKKQYLKKKKKCLGSILYKSIYKLDKTSCITEYKSDLPLLILDIKEFKDFDNSSKLLNFIDEDITKNKRYSDIYIAKFGFKNLHEFNIYNAFKKVKDNKKGDNMKDAINKNMNSSDAIRVELFSLYKRLLKNTADIFKSENKNEDILLKFRSNLEKLIFIIKEYKKIFEPEFIEKVSENLELIYNHTDTHSQIVSIRSNFTTLNKCLKKTSFKSFLTQEDEYISKKVEDFIVFLKTREFDIITKQLELLITEGSKEEDKEFEKTIEQSLNKKLKKGIKKAKKTFKKKIDCDDEKGINKIIRKFSTISVLQSEFNYLFEREELYSDKESIDKIIKKLNLYSSILKFEKLLTSKNNNFKNKEFKCLNKEINKQKSKLLKKVKKSFKNL